MARLPSKLVLAFCLPILGVVAAEVLWFAGTRLFWLPLALTGLGLLVGLWLASGVRAAERRDRDERLSAFVEVRASEAALRTERDRLLAVLGSMSEGVLVLDGQERVTLANPSVRKLLSLPESRPGDGATSTTRRCSI